MRATRSPMYTVLLHSSVNHLQNDASSICLGSIDDEKEKKDERKRKRMEGEEERRKREEERRQRDEEIVTWESTDDEDDSDDDENYAPSHHGHDRKRPKSITLEFNVDELRKSHSTIADRHRQSAAARSDTLSNFIERGGGNLCDVPCSSRTMTKCVHAVSVCRSRCLSLPLSFSFSIFRSLSLSFSFFFFRSESTGMSCLNLPVDQYRRIGDRRHVDYAFFHRGEDPSTVKDGCTGCSH